MRRASINRKRMSVVGDQRKRLMSCVIQVFIRKKAPHIFYSSSQNTKRDSKSIFGIAVAVVVVV